VCQISCLRGTAIHGAAVDEYLVLVHFYHTYVSIQQFIILLRLGINQLSTEVEVEVTLQLTVNQSVCQGIEPTLGLVTRYYFLTEGCFLKVAVLSLWGALSDERSGLSFVILLNVFQIIYINSVRTSQETNYVATTKPNRLMLFTEPYAVHPKR
jgi:hypothetical protein